MKLIFREIIINKLILFNIVTWKIWRWIKLSITSLFCKSDKFINCYLYYLNYHYNAFLNLGAILGSNCMYYLSMDCKYFFFLN